METGDAGSNIFADGSHEITFLNGTVRIEFFVFDTSRRLDDGTPAQTIVKTVILPLPGFLKMVADGAGFVRKLEAEQKIVRTDSAGNPSADGDSLKAGPNAMAGDDRPEPGKDRTSEG